MGGLKTSANSSLEQLKALDSISGLEDQLDEATRLCTHRVRADMILKWLLEKLKKDPIARINSQTWKTLAATLRLLSPERIGALLSSSALFRPMQIALSGRSNVGDRLETLADLLDLLIETSDAPSGVPVKAILSLPSKDAAVFLGVWVKAINNYNEHEVPRLSEWQRYINLGFQIWALRKHSTDENQHFADECLLPVTRLLSTASTDLQLFSDVPEVERLSRKRRRRGHHAALEHPDIDLPMLHLARHVFIPARKDLSQAQSQPRSKETSGHQLFAYSSAATLEGMLGSMRMLAQSIRTDESSDLVDYISRLLDVALRCISVETPKQKSAEKPWILALWHAFYDILCSIPVETATSSIAAMISVFHERSISLSEEILRDVAHRFGALRERDVNWSIIAKIIALDAGTFANAALAEPLFTAVTTAVANDERLLNTDLPSAKRNLQHMWTHPIVVPVMQAIVRAQNAPLFLRVWAQHLTQDNHEYQLSVWTDLDASFPPLMEDSLADEQILQLFAPVYNKFEAQGSSSISQSELNAAIVVLHALLCGIKRDHITHKIMPELERILMIAPSATSDSISPFQEWRYWSLAEKAFELWFPLWAAQQSDTDTIIARAHDALASPAIAAAFATMQSEPGAAEPGQTTSALPGHVEYPHPGQDACDPAHLVMTVCYQLYTYPTLRTVCEDRLNKLVRIMEVGDLPALLRYPAFLSIIEGEALHGLLQKCITEEAEGLPTNASTMLALITSEISQGKNHMIDPTLDALLPVFGINVKDGGPVTRNYVIMTLIEISPMSLSRAQRERILNALTASSWESGSRSANLENQRRLALIIRLMQTANPTCDLSADPTAIRRIAGQITNEDDDTNGTPNTFKEGNSTLILLKEVARRVVAQLIATQDQQRSREVLSSFSEQIVKDLGKPSKLKWNLKDSRLFSLSIYMLNELDAGCKPLLTDALSHREPKFAKKLIKSLLDKVYAIFHDLLGIEVPQIGQEEQAYPSILDALLDMNPSHVGLSDQQREEIVETSTVFLQSTLSPKGQAELSMKDSETGPNLSGPSLLKLVLTRAFCIVNTFAPSDVSPEILGLADKLLQLKLDPVEHNHVEKAFEQGVERLSHHSRLLLIRALLTNEGGLTREGLILLPICIKNLDKEALDIGQKPQIGSVLHTLVNNALQTSDLVIFTRAMQCIDTILKEEPFLANQHAIETILINLSKLARNDRDPATSYESATGIFTTLFLSHRSRLQGRYHLVVRALQQLLSQLFISTDFSSASTSPRVKPEHTLTVAHAAAFARLLTLLCDPPQQRQPSAVADGLALIDVARREQAHAGQHVPVLLHQFCVQMLHGRLAGDGMREALNPGLWAAIEAMEMHEAHGVRVLSSSMNENERAVLRGVYDEWRRFGKWRGG